ncbi:uncharacterized protein N0V89_010110 [Didymosphaeria variabile]|uniref:Target of rapamycin complex subunit LST8 n=1 Tax=Didymosphaeria variabile TaxID=1932322 RepID=A0A9W9C783_9PLEO|nr:uncharacterized protein N0V89_010110 [Didymosphaeria variabile]KAJ4348732.1 hypothetical protein N0V89_010110 [Didymosphaeria variabile]
MGSSTEEPIDLTLDSDDEPGPTLAPSGSSKMVPGFLPAGNFRPSSSSIPQFQGTSTSVSGFQLPNSRPKPSLPKFEPWSPYATIHDDSANPNTTSSSGPRNGHIPVFTAATPAEEADDFAIPQAEKRRKISGPPLGAEFNLPGPARRRIGPKPKYYGVKVGHIPGVYTDWDTAKAQIVGCKKSSQQRFETREEAQAFIDGRLSPNPKFDPNRVELPPWNGGARPSSLNSLVTTPTNSADGKQASATSPAIGTQSVGGRPPDPTMKLSTNGLPSVQSLNTVLKTNGASMPFAGNNEASRTLRELQFGRLSDAVNEANKSGSKGIAIAQSSAGETIMDQNTSFPARQGTSVQIMSETKNGLSKDEDTTVEDPFTMLLEDDIVSELLRQAPANDKVALLLKAHPRGQLIARTIPTSPLQTSLNRKRRGRPSLRDTRSPPAVSPSERDSLFSVPDTPTSGDAVHTHNTVSNLPTAHGVVATVEKPSASKTWMGGLSEAEAHLLIFLKEVKKLKWTEITARFQEHYPDRAYSTLQTNYSQKINRRDRSHDPSTLILPSMYASEAHIDWAKIHSNPRNDHAGRKREVISLQEEPQHRAWSAVVGSLQDQSSGAESASHHTRPRRAVPKKNYTWPKRNALVADDDDFDTLGPTEEKLNVSETPETTVPAPEKAIAIDNESVSIDFDGDDAFSALSLHKGEASIEQLPFLSSSQRSDLQNVPCGYEWDQLISRDWQGTLIHADFSPTELNLVESTMTHLLGPQRDLRLRSRRKRLGRMLRGLSEPKLLQLASALRSKLRSRDRRSIDAFLRDAKQDKIRCDAPRIERLAASRPTKSFSSDAKLSTSAMIRRRELGIQSHRGWSSATAPIPYHLKNKVQDSLGPVCSYTGAAGDVHAVAWSVDGECFAAGAICVSDDHSMQYNRSNNLLYGDVSRNTINELGKHYDPRPKTDTGPNSTHAMYVSQDPKLFKTVESVAFSPNGRYMFSGGWDHNVWVWKTRYDGSQPTDIVSLRHKAEVTHMAVNASGVLATGTKRNKGNTVKVLNLYDDDLTQSPDTTSFSSEKAAARPDLLIRPMALHFSPRYENLLLGGFGANARQDGRDMSGDICLWDINANKQLNIWGSGKNVYDLSFHPRERWMAVATVAGQNTNRGMRSTVRLYTEQGNAMDDRFSTLMELECRALDINDVVWCPGNNYLVAAGCTSGRAYVWDIRNPNHLLRELAHGNSLMPLEEGVDPEISDTGIRFLSWGDNATRLYSGSSDGVVKVWNVARSEEETFVKDLATFDSGVMSGAFSPDHSRLLLGEVNGSINVLEVGRDDCSLRDAERMKFIPYKDNDPDYETQYPPLASAAADSGIAAAKELIETGQMTITPMGGLPVKQAVQGPLYAGPYDASVDAPFLREQALESQLKFSERPESPCSLCLGPGSDPMKITSEEIGDSGRSKDRIPDELRLQWEAGTVNLKMPPGKIPCSRCGRAAHPSDYVNYDGRPFSPVCVRCDFSCPRCDHYGQLPHKTDVFDCLMCGRTWELGALGFDLVKDGSPTSYEALLRSQGRAVDESHDIPKLDGYKKDLYLAKLEAESSPGDDGGSFGDEMNALTDYYFSLAIDRPESPSL